MIDIRQNDNGTALNVSGDTIARSYAEGTVLSLPKNSVYMVLEDDSDLVVFRNVSDSTVLFQGLINEITIDGQNITRDNIVSSFDAVSNSSASGGSDYEPTVHTLNVSFPTAFNNMSSNFRYASISHGISNFTSILNIGDIIEDNKGKRVTVTYKENNTTFFGYGVLGDSANTPCSIKINNTSILFNETSKSYNIGTNYTSNYYKIKESDAALISNLNYYAAKTSSSSLTPSSTQKGLQYNAYKSVKGEKELTEYFAEWNNELAWNGNFLICGKTYEDATPTTILNISDIYDESTFAQDNMNGGYIYYYDGNGRYLRFESSYSDLLRDSDIYVDGQKIKSAGSTLPFDLPFNKEIRVVNPNYYGSSFIQGFTPPNSHEVTFKTIATTIESTDATDSMSVVDKGKMYHLLNEGNVKTINGQSIYGQGDIKIQGGEGGGSDIDAYTKQESDAKFATKSSLESVENNVNSIKTNITNIEGKVQNIPTVQSNQNGTTNNYIYSSGTFPVVSDVDVFVNSAGVINITQKNWYSSVTNKFIEIPVATQTANGVMSKEDKIKLDNLSEGGGGGLTPEQEEELKSLRNDVEQALGEIAELGADKQNKLIGNYLVKFEQNGGQIDFTQRGFDGLSESTKTISFKTVNGQSLLGQGDLKIEGGGSIDAYSKQEADNKFATITYVDDTVGNINKILENILG